MFSKITKNIGESVGSAPLQNKVNELIEEELPRIQAHFRESIGNATSEKLQDDVLMAKCFGGIYSLVPLPIRLVVKKPAFIEFCLSNRYRIAGVEAPSVE